MSEDAQRWMEKSMPCSACKQGVSTVYKPSSDGSVTKFSFACPVCMGTGSVIRSVPASCQIEGCTEAAVHQCSGPICDDAWVCSTHWMVEDIGFSPTGHACETCWHEVGSGGH